MIINTNRGYIYTCGKDNKSFLFTSNKNEAVIFPDSMTYEEIDLLYSDLKLYADAYIIEC